MTVNQTTADDRKPPVNWSEHPAFMGTNYKRYTVDLPAFNGPLDLLLHLIEREELDITAISLVQVTEQYLTQVEQMKVNRIENLIDFIVLGARLVQIKSRALLPKTPIVALEGEEEEDPAEALIRQLRQYKRFKQVALWLHQREVAGLRTYLRLAPPPKLEKTLDLSGVTVDKLTVAMQKVLERAELRQESVSVVLPRRITIEGQLSLLRHRLRKQPPFLFGELLSQQVDRTEVAVTLLALLELIKRREAAAYQTALFGPIEIDSHKPTTSAAAAPAESG